MGRLPIPYYGAKEKIAPEIWRRFGRVDGYIEPFVGTAAVYLSAPFIPRHVVLNDIDGRIVNALRAVARDALGVARAVDAPVSEVELFARREALMSERAGGLRERLIADPDYFDAALAGAFMYAQANTAGYRLHDRHGFSLRVAKGGGAGVARMEFRGGPMELGRRYAALFEEIAQRLRPAVLLARDWADVVRSDTLLGTVGEGGAVGVFLDPPYAIDGRRNANGLARVYENDDGRVGEVVGEWARRIVRERPQVRVALCAYEGDYDMPEGWREFRWRAKSGGKEVVHFSPNCLQPGLL